MNITHDNVTTTILHTHKRKNKQGSFEYKQIAPSFEKDVNEMNQHKHTHMNTMLDYWKEEG